MNDQITVYSARANPRFTTIGAVKNLIADAWQYRWHIGQMFKRDFAGNYRLTRFGVVWNFILPLVPISVWVMLNSLRFFPSFNGVSSVVFVTFGITLWFLFAGFVSLPISTIESKIKQVSVSGLPLIGVIIASFASLSFDTLVRLVGTVLVFLIFHGAPDWRVIFTPIIVLFAMLFFSGAGLILATVNLAYRDVRKVVTIALQYGMLLSSVLFPLDGIPFLAKASLFNPFYVFIDAIRTLTVFGELHHPVALFAFCYASVVVFLFACRLFQASEQRIKGFA